MSAAELPAAVYVSRAQGYWLGDARLYDLATPLAYGNRGRVASRVIVHAIPGDGTTPGETVIMAACTDSGLIDTYQPLGGSPRRGIDHRRALRAAGYEIARAGRAA